MNRDLPKGVCCYRSAVEWGLYQLGKKEDISKRSGVSSDASVLTYLRMQVLLWWENVSFPPGRVVCKEVFLSKDSLSRILLDG